MDERKESGEFYPGGRASQGGGGSGGEGGDTAPKVPVTHVDELPERYREGDVRTKINQLARIISGGVAALAAMVATAQVTVQGARKDALWNDDFVVTNVTVALDGLVTTNQLEEARRSDGEALLQEMAGATNAVTAELIGEIAGATNAVTAELIGKIAGATNAVAGERATALAPYATKDWVNAQGFAEGSALEGYATQGWVAEQGYAPKSWVEGRGYMTGTNLAPYATKEWVEGRGYATGTNLADATEGVKGWVQGQGYATRTEVENVQAVIGPTVRAEVGEAVRDIVYERDVAQRVEAMEDAPAQTNGWRMGSWIDGNGIIYEVDIVTEGTNVVGLVTNATELVRKNWFDEAVVDALETATNYTQEVAEGLSNLSNALERGEMQVWSAFSALNAQHADRADNSVALSDGTSQRSGAQIFAQLDAASHITTNDVCSIVTNETAGAFGEWVWSCSSQTMIWGLRPDSMEDTGYRYAQDETPLHYEQGPEGGVWVVMFRILSYDPSYDEFDPWGPDWREFAIPGNGDETMLTFDCDYYGTITATRTYTPGENALGLARMTDLPMVETNAINAAMAYTDSKEYTVVERPTVYKYYVTTNANIEAGGGDAQVITNAFPGMAFDLYETNSVYFIDGSVPTLKFFAPYRRQAYWPNMVTAVEIGDPMQVLRTYFFQVDGNMAVNSPTNIRFMATLDRNAPYDQGRAMSLQDYLDAFNPVLVPETIRLFQTNRSNYSVGNVTAHTSLSVARANGEKSFEVTPEAANFMDSMKVVPSVGRIRYIEGMTNEQGTVTNYYAYAVTNADVEITGNVSVSDSVAVSNLSVKGAMRFSSWDNIGVQNGRIVFSLSNFVYQLCGPMLKYTFGDVMDCAKHYLDWRENGKTFRIHAFSKYKYLYDASVMDAYQTITNVVVVLPNPDGSLVGRGYLPNDMRSYLDTKFIFDLEGISHAITLDIGSCNFTNRTNRWGIEGEWTTIYSDVEPTNIVEQVVHTETTVYYDWIEDPETGEWVEDTEHPHEITTEWYDEYSMDMIWRLEPYKAYEFHIQQIGPTTMRLGWKQLYRTNPRSGN